jgi:hypothetical protein
MEEINGIKNENEKTIKMTNNNCKVEVEISTTKSCENFYCCNLVHRSHNRTFVYLRCVYSHACVTVRFLGNFYHTFYTWRLRLHMKTHQGDRRFKCEICSKAFMFRSSLKTHMFTHNDSKEFLWSTMIINLFTTNATLA